MFFKKKIIKSALEDLRNIINHVNRGAAFPARKDDFASEEAYNNRKTIELKQITENIAVMVQLNPGLAPKESTEVRRTLLSSDPNKRTTLSSNPRRTTFTGSMHPETMNDAFRQYEATRSTEQYSQNQHPGYSYPYNQQPPSYPPYNPQQPPSYPPYNSQQPPYP